MPIFLKANTTMLRHQSLWVKAGQRTFHLAKVVVHPN